MSFVLNDEQRMLQDQVRSLLAERAAPDRLRKLIKANAGWDEDLWKSLAELGVLGAGVPEAFGGVGLGPVEVGVIAQEIGRAVAPVPFFSSICLAAEALMLAGTQAQKEKWLPQLASGEAVGTFAWTEAPGRPSFTRIDTILAGGKLNGRKTPVPDAAIAQVCVVVAKSGGDLTLSLVELDQPGVTRTDVVGIDELRHFAEIEFKNAVAEPMDGAPGSAALDQLWNRAAIYASFEQVGGAEACLYMVRDYTQQRYVFARTLASYQAVKHALADMLAKVELAQCNALYAGKALRDAQPDIAVAAAAARIGATEAYELAARENLQFHGGIGFTWEANCHFHYRRARMLALSLGSAQTWTDRLITALDAQTPAQSPAKSAAQSQRSPDSPEDAEYRAKARAWLAENAAEYKNFGEIPEAEFPQRSKAWTRKKWDAGYSGIEYPLNAGGAGGTARQAQIFAEEEAAYDVPRGAQHFLAMVAYEQYGTPEQVARWGRSMHSGEGLWTQLFSEPSAGSDLAALRTRAVRQGDNWIVNGQKIWSSGAHRADFGFMIARTDPKAPKHKGLSFFFINMRQPGIEVRPIRQMTGDSEFNEVFFTDAVVPDADRMGAEGQGWAVAMSILGAERAHAGTVGQGESPVATTNLLRAARRSRTDTGCALDDGAIRSKLASFYVDEQGVKNFAQRMMQQMAGGQTPQTMPIMKLTSSIRNQLAYAFLQDMEDVCGVVKGSDRPADEDKYYDYLYSPIWRIAGGAEQVLKNQLAERALGMPGDVRFDRDVPFEDLPA